MKLVVQIQEYCRDRNAKCPHCGKKISMKQRTVFLLRGTAHYINCEHCGGAMHPTREAIPFVYGTQGVWNDVLIFLFHTQPFASYLFGSTKVQNNSGPT